MTSRVAIGFVLPVLVKAFGVCLLVKKSVDSFYLVVYLVSVWCVGIGR